MATRIQIRRGLAATWTSINPILFEGEEGYELDTGKRKVGNGTDTWNSLPYTPIGISAVSAGTTNQTIGGVSFVDGNGFSIGLNNSSLTFSYTVPAVTNSSITISDSLTSGTLGRLAFGTLNGITLYLSTTTGGSHTLLGSHNALTTQFNQAFSAQGGSSSFQTLAFANSNGITFSNSNGSVIASHNGITQQSTQPVAASGSNGSFAFSTLSFGNSNGFSFYTTNGSIVGSYTAAGGADGYNILAAGTQTANTTGTVVFSNSNGITFGMSNSSVITASYTVPTQSNQTVGLYALGNTTQNSSTTLDARTLSFNGIGGITVGYSNGSIQISGPQTAAQTNQSIGWYGVGNTTQNSSTTLDARTISVGGRGDITVGYSNGTLQISGSQSNQNISLFALGNTTQNSSTLLNASNLSFNAIGSLTIGYSNGSIQFSAPNAITSQSNQNISLFAIGNTTQNSSTLLNASNLSFNGIGNATVGFSNGSIQISVAGGGGGIAASIGGNSTSAGAGYSNITSGTMFLMGGPNITLSQNGASISISANDPGAAAENNWHHLLGANTAGNTTASGSTIGLSGINLTLSGTNGSVVNISAPAVSSLSATGQVSIQANGSTISIGVPGKVTMSRYAEFKESPLVVGDQGQASLHIQPWIIPDLQMDRAVVRMQMSNATNSSGSFTISNWIGIYTKTGSTLSLLASASNTTNFTGSGTAGSYSLYGGIRNMSIGLTTTLTEGMYWIGVLRRTTSGGANQTVSQLLVSQLNSNFSGEMGVGSNATKQLMLGFGVYTTSTLGMPASINFNQINGTASMALRPPHIFFVSESQ